MRTSYGGPAVAYGSSDGKCKDERLIKRAQVYTVHGGNWQGDSKLIGTENMNLSYFF